MSKLDEKGFAAGRPLKPEQWAEFYKGAPAGRVISNNTIPPGLFVIQNYLDPSWCDALRKECDAIESERHPVGVRREDGSIESILDDARISESIRPSQLKTDITSVVRQSFQTAVAQHFQVELEWFETPEILRYREGGQYSIHADADIWTTETKSWTRVLDRDLSLLLYINDEFEGGRLIFPNCGFTIVPRRGLLVAFPSDWRYIHGAYPVTKGIRYAIVSWAAVRGGPRVHATPQDPVIRF
ncbi:MAG: prolyl hydroxylase family protein [Hyphococcus sp.]